jgi:hypothetical protein
MAEGLTLAGSWIVAAWGGLCLLVVILGAVAAWDLRPESEVYNTRRRLEALLARDRDRAA